MPNFDGPVGRTSDEYIIMEVVPIQPVNGHFMGFKGH